MLENDIPIVMEGESDHVIHVVRPLALAKLLSELTLDQSAFLIATGFQAREQELVLLSGPGGMSAAILGLGDAASHVAFGDLAFRLPAGTWRLVPGDFDIAQAVLGFCLGAYRFSTFKALKRLPAKLSVSVDHGIVTSISHAISIWMARDLVNTPANLLGPSELADAVAELAQHFGANFTRTEAADLDRLYPAIAAVGRGSDRAPVVASFTWQGSKAPADAKLISLCGKGVVFDSGGYDLKPSAGMLRMKKDMGGAASMLALARMIMAADLPLRLAVRIGCVENSVSGRAMRPLDVLRTRRGLSVEIGNTDAEGRLVLCDLLAEASDENPALLLDCATLTGAARVALGPDIPALFCNNDAWAEALQSAGARSRDPMWRMPLWDGYDSWLDSPIADCNNVSTKPFAGAVVAALFLRRFVAPGVAWAHLDTYSWNDTTSPARPEGGEVFAMRACFGAIEAMLLQHGDALA